MSLYASTNLSPNNIGIIPTNTNTFSWDVNATSPDSQTAFQVIIYNNSNVGVYDSGVIYSTVSSFTLPENTLTVNTIYKWKVTVYSGLTSVSSQWVIFKTNSSPAIALDLTDFTTSSEWSDTTSQDGSYELDTTYSFNDTDDGSVLINYLFGIETLIVLPKQNYNFPVTYSHPENIPLKTFRYILYNELGTDILIDSGQQYPPSLLTSGTISYLIEGMITDTVYNFECQVIDQNNMFVTTGLILFSTQYAYPDDSNELTITPLNNLGAIQLDWSTVQQVLGSINTSGTYSYEDVVTSGVLVSATSGKALHLDNGAILTYTSTLPIGFSLIYFCKLPSGFIGDLVKLGTDYIFGYNGSRFTFLNQYRITASMPRTLPTDWFLIGLKGTEIIIVTTSYTEILS